MNVFDIAVWDIDVNVFSIRLMRQILERRSLPWTPSSLLQFTPLPYRRADGYIENHILQITIVLEKLSLMEYIWDEEEFEHLHTILGGSEEDFIDFFVNSVSMCYINSYSPFNFLRWLRYIVDFSVFCCIKGLPVAIDIAVVSISRMIFTLQNVFTDWNNWRKLINETGRILNNNFLHPYMFNSYLHRRNGLVRSRFRANRQRR